MREGLNHGEHHCGCDKPSMPGEEKVAHAAHHNATAGHEGHGEKAHVSRVSYHAHMVADFRRRFWVCLVVTVPVLLLSPLIQVSSI